MTVRLCAVGMILASVCVFLCVSGAGAAGPAAASQPVVLDTAGFWRMHHTMNGPVFLGAGGATSPVPLAAPPGGWDKLWEGFFCRQTPAPPADWAKAEFDDSSWFRGPARRACRTPFLERLCLRGRFTVSDPAKAKDLSLALEYHGGAVVYLNGQEIARQNLPAPSTGSGQAAALAEAYPLDAYVDEAGKLITLRGDEPMWRSEKPTAEVAKRIASRERKLTAVLPAKSLRPGVNVVAIEIVRAPYNKVLQEQTARCQAHGDYQVCDVSWSTCEIRRVQLTAPSADGLVGGAVRPAGFQVWNSDPAATDWDLDFGDPSETLHPIQLVGAQNCSYSGKVGVGCDKPIRGLAATAGELKGAGGSIPAANVRIRYGMPWAVLHLTSEGMNELVPYPAEPAPLLAMFDTAPKEVPVYTKEITSRCMNLPGQPPVVFGAVTSVWVTVKVPADAKPGTYSGEVQLSAEGWKGAAVPVSVKVIDCKIADPPQWRTWVELVQSPDTLMVEYNLPMWSPKHWEMIEKSLGFLGDVGSKVIYVPLIAQCNVGNAESMVRWIKKGENQYEYDFTIMDKYLDLAQKRMGKPAVVIFNAWDAYMPGNGKVGEMKTGKVGTGLPLVTVLDPATGKTQNVTTPAYSDAAGKAVWKPLFDQLRERMKKRGLEDAMHLGMTTDVGPLKDLVEGLKDISGDLPWSNAGHYVRQANFLHGVAKYGYQSSYFSSHFGETDSLHGWASPNLYALFERVELDGYPMSKWRTFAEQAVTGDIRGVGRTGADTWFAVRDKAGRRAARVWERYPLSDWMMLNVGSSMLAPSPEGPVATMRVEALREGAEESEAIIVLEKAVLEKKLDAETAKRVKDLLTERRVEMWRSLGVWQIGAKFGFVVTSWRERPAVTGYTWFVGSGWQDRSERLYRLAGEVQKKVAAK